jgi:hypothetical protein
MGDQMSKLLDVGSEERAAVICGKLHDIFAKLEDLIGLVDREVDSEQQAIEFRKAIACVCGPIALDVLAPLYRKYPSLKPDTWPTEL